MITRTSGGAIGWRREPAVIEDGAPGQVLIHVEVALLPGRPPEDESRLSRAVIELVKRHTGG
ncbi:hypothetical protein ABZX75_07990 [Streptomyces sp. NPDC003038]|uniref:hypothetical protein n=1 Tax=unclassified Streptomyces TaxID=2593676 RepID=UPI0033A6EEC9